MSLEQIETDVHMHGRILRGDCGFRGASRAAGTIVASASSNPGDGGEDVFCHFPGIKDGNALGEGDRVEFGKVHDDRQGKHRAENVTERIQQDMVVATMVVVSTVKRSHREKTQVGRNHWESRHLSRGVCLGAIVNVHG